MNQNFQTMNSAGSTIARQVRGGNSDIKLIMKNAYTVFPDITPLGDIHDCRII